MGAFTIPGSATNLVLTKGTPPTTVTVFITDEKENLTKALIAINPPQTTGNQPADPANAVYNMKIIDILNKVEQRLTLTGYIDSTDGGDTAETKRTKLRNMFLSGGLVTVTTYGGVFDGKLAGIDKLEFAKVLNDNLTGDGIAEYMVTISLLFGAVYGS